MPFLGLSVAERNARVVRRATQSREAAGTNVPTLTVPAGVAITPALVAGLPPPTGLWHLRWNPDRPAIVWRGAGRAAAEIAVMLDVPDGAALDVSTAAARRRAAWRLVCQAGKTTDGWLSRHVHRKVSRLFSFVLLQLGLSANVATFLTFLVGASSAWLMAQTSRETMIAGGLLFWFASIADGIDGEMARVTLGESARGEQIDTIADQATYLLCYAGVMVGWWRQGIGPAGRALALGGAAAIPIVLLWAMHLVRRGRGFRDRFFVDTKPIELGIVGAAAVTHAPLLRAASWVFVLFRREALSLGVFLVALTTGRRAVYPTLVALGIAIVVLTLTAYQRAIEQAIRAESPSPTPIS